VIPEIGHFALILAFLLALVQATPVFLLAGRGARHRAGGPGALGEAAAAGHLLFLAISYLALTYAYVTSDFSILNVAQNSHSAKPLLYKISGVWGNHEGSMMLWVLILAIFGASVVFFGRNLPPGLRARVLGVQGMIGAAFIAFILFTSNPFLRLFPTPEDGNGLNPMLQDPGLAFHPPLLYLGYVGFSMAFSFAIAALLEGRVDAAWARWVRPWTLAAWAFLTLGIGLGSWWAYYELGWGGFWFWDPVENASLMPWLAGTALVHSVAVVDKRDTLKGWTVLLAILTFALSLLGAFIVRSGVLTSVHAFATDPSRGVFILALLTVTVGGSLALFAWRAPTLTPGGLFRPISREGGLLLNNILLSTAAATVAVGTLYPLFLESLTGDKISVGPPFYHLSFVPLMAPLVVLTAIGPLLPWKRADILGALQRLRVALAVAVGVVLLAWWLSGGPLGAVLGIGLAGWLLAGTATELAGRVKLWRVPLAESARRARRLPRSAWGMVLAHTGLAVLIIGAVSVSVWQTERIEVMRNGEAVSAGGYRFVFQGVKEVAGPNYMARRGTIAVERDGKPVVTLYPEKRFYPVRGNSTTEAAIYTTGLLDLYAVIGDPQPAEGETEVASTPAAMSGWVVRIHHIPFAPWIWAGTVLMALGGGVSLSDRRHRVGVPVRRATLGPV
jgi:cytochrome c-type biogenesis protein CcmF